MSRAIEQLIFTARNAAGVLYWSNAGIVQRTVSRRSWLRDSVLSFAEVPLSNSHASRLNVGIVPELLF